MSRSKAGRRASFSASWRRANQAGLLAGWVRPSSKLLSERVSISHWIWFGGIGRVCRELDEEGRAGVIAGSSAGTGFGDRQPQSVPVKSFLLPSTASGRFVFSDYSSTRDLCHRTVLLAGLKQLLRKCLVSFFQDSRTLRIIRPLSKVLCRHDTRIYKKNHRAMG